MKFVNIIIFLQQTRYSQNKELDEWIEWNCLFTLSFTKISWYHNKQVPGNVDLRSASFVWIFAIMRDVRERQIFNLRWSGKRLYAKFTSVYFCVGTIADGTCWHFLLTIWFFLQLNKRFVFHFWLFLPAIWPALVSYIGVLSLYDILFDCKFMFAFGHYRLSFWEDFYCCLYHHTIRWVDLRS